MDPAADRTVISRYQIIEKLGEGGMGVVYRALDTRLNRPVALKILPPGLGESDERRLRFRQEAQAASALNHPNIITIYDIGETDVAVYIAMEYVAGRTLDKLIPPNGMRLEDALKYGIQIVDGIGRAHAAGIVHRDLKPGNVMVTDEGVVKVLDFGVAKLTETAQAGGDASASGPRTASGVLLGTPAFMSPEQATGDKVDARSDIFSFGAMLYEMLTGRRAFRADSHQATIAAVLSREPEPMPDRIPGQLSNVVLRCLRKDPARRFQSMTDLKAALDDLRGEPAPGRSRAASRPYWIAAGIVSLLVAAGLFAWQTWRLSRGAHPVRAVPLTTLPGVHRYPSFSPDGNTIAFSWTGPRQGNTDVYVQQVGTATHLQLTTHPRNDYNPVWSPDGRWIAFLRLGSDSSISELRLIAPLGGPEREIARIRVRGEPFVTAPYLAWCPDSHCVVVADSPSEGRPAGLFVVSLDTGEKRRLTDPRPPASGDSHPAISSDGAWLVFRRSAGLFNGELYRLALGRNLMAAGQPQRLTAAALDASHPAWMPDSREILFSAKGNLWRLVVPGENTPARLPFVGEDGLMPAVSRPQPGQRLRLAYVRSFDDYNIWRIEIAAPGAPASSPPVVAVSSTRADDMPALSPDGHRVAFTSDRSGEWEIWLADPDGSNAVQLTSMSGQVAGYPHWSPDGRLISFHSTSAGQWDVFVVPAAGGKPRNLTSHGARESFPSFSRDGRWIYFTSNRTGEDRIWKLPASGGDAVQVTNDLATVPLESPDGTQLYYVQTAFTPSALWRVPVAGGLPVKVLDGIVLGNFIVLDRGIYYIDRPSGDEGIYSVDRPSGETRLRYLDFTTGRTATIATNLGNVDTPLTVSSDGRTIMYARMDSSVDDLMLVENFR